MPSDSATAFDGSDPLLLPDGLSIVVQGGLTEGGQIEVARNCEHWRSLFPDADIVLSISASDLLREPLAGVMPDLIPARHVADDSHVTAAFASLRRSCDTIVMAKPALPLPPIKTNVTEPNNVNLQIAAAKAGLAVVSRARVLRVRSDLIFADASFVDQYEDGAALPRGSAAVLRDRVLISSTYTLNPFAFERMPFHFSDWFHYGRTEDLRALWQAPAMSLADATFFDHQPHQVSALYEERLRRTRLAVEQHVAFDLAHRRFAAKLDEACDMQSRDRSLDYLCDNFIVCDLAAARCILPKYAAELADPSRTIHCLTAPDWRDLATASTSERPAIAAQRAAMALHPEHRAFPRRYPAASLSVPGGHHSTVEICAARVAGVVSHGPYDALPRGHYLARVVTSLLTGPGRLTLRATAFGGNRFLSHSTVAIPLEGDVSLELAFDIHDVIATGIEIVVEGTDLSAICITALEIALRPGPSLVERERRERRGIRRRLRRAWRWLRRRTFGQPGPKRGVRDGRLWRAHLHPVPIKTKA